MIGIRSRVHRIADRPNEAATRPVSVRPPVAVYLIVRQSVILTEQGERRIGGTHRRCGVSNQPLPLDDISCGQRSWPK